ncbi:DUF7382 domain-containing protein [Halorarius halobius]|uniref:DUF7382 domain-containing protein n=1 Tax=Halorarius halobius TaxID=2962671 RepID=UPI0020CEF36D|nr:carboxypeptidase regulatory-like domain-containing protein [Halorarius halobius]
MFERFRTDERAIEGLPVRLVVALVVGVASLSVMLNMLSGLAAIGVTELDTQPVPEVTDPGNTTLAVRVVDPDGGGVANATVVARGETVSLESPAVARTNASGYARLQVAPRLGPNQPDGELGFEVKPPAGSQYVDRRGNTRVLVVRG